MSASGNKQEGSLYFHIPFCSRKCPYCHFFVLPNEERFKKALLDALALEWKQTVSKLASHKIVSIYFGGGTPSLFGPAAIAQVLDWIRSSGVECAENCEITIEANPEETSILLIKGFADAGINRLSLGVQSLNDALLKQLGRQHDAKRALNAIYEVHAAGIHNISIDLMYELPNQTLESWKSTLHELSSLPITHLSLYNLTIEPETLFFKRRKQLTPLLPAPEVNLEMLHTAVSFLEKIGLKRYEISAFAKEGYQSRHNSGYWLARPFLGLGPSAFSYWKGKRFRNVAHLGKYTEALQGERSPVDFEEELSEENKKRELLAVQLRLSRGVELQTFEKQHGLLSQELHQTIDQLIKKGWLELRGTLLKLSQEGTLFYDSVATELI